MRMTEFMQFCKEGPTMEQIQFRYSHIDVNDLNGKMIGDKEFGDAVKRCRKEWKKLPSEK